MNNHVQQRFDRSIREAVDATRQLKRVTPRSPRATQAAVAAAEAEQRITEQAGRRPGWKLYLCPLTGATVYGPR